MHTPNGGRDAALRQSARDARDRLSATPVEEARAPPELQPRLGHQLDANEAEPRKPPHRGARKPQAREHRRREPHPCPERDASNEPDREPSCDLRNSAATQPWAQPVQEPE